MAQTVQPNIDHPATIDAGAGAKAPSAGPKDFMHMAWLAGAARGRRSDDHSYLLLARFALLNFGAFALLGAAWVHGLVEIVIAADRTNIVFGIFGVFLFGLGLCGWKIMRASEEMNRIKAFDPLVRSKAADYAAQIRGLAGDGRNLMASSLRLKLLSRIQVVRQFANSLVVLGLIGTVIGFIIALSGVDPESASDVKSIAPMVSSLIEGLSTALYTTLIGSVLNVWLMINYRLLAGGTVKLITALIDFGEDNARA